MKKRYIIALLAAAMLSLTACGGSQEQETEKPAEENTVEDAEESTEESTAEEVVFYDSVSFDTLTSKVVKLGAYKGIEAEKTVQEITEEDVQAEIDGIWKNYATLEDVDRAAGPGDVTVIDFTGYVDAETSESLQGTEHPLELGSGSFIPGFEDQLVGVSADADVEVKVTFPEDYHAPEMAGKDALFEVHVHKVQEYVNNDWNDEFIRTNLGVESEDALRESLRAEMEAMAEETAEANLEYNLIVDLIQASEFQVEDADIQACTDEMMNQYISMAAQYGMALNELMEYMGTTEADVRELYKETARFRVQMMLALQQIVEAEGLETTEEERTAYKEAMAAEYGYEVADIEDVYSEDMIIEQLLQEKAIGLIRDNAVIL